MDIVIRDDEIETIANFCNETGEALENMYSRYVAAMKSIRDNALKDGESAAKLDIYIRYAEHLLHQIYDVSCSAKSNVNNYLAGIDEADSYLF